MDSENSRAALAQHLLRELHKHREPDIKSVGRPCNEPTCGELSHAGDLCPNCIVKRLGSVCGDTELPYRIDSAISTLRHLEATLLRLASK